MSVRKHRGTSGAITNHPRDLEWFGTKPGEQMAIRLLSPRVSGAFTILEARVPVFNGPPRHYHKDREEIFEILDGTFRFQCGEEVFDAKPGTSIVVPRGVPHTWANMGKEIGRILFTFSPVGIDGFFAQIGLIPPEEWTRLYEKYDTWIIGPPLFAEEL